MSIYDDARYKILHYGLNRGYVYFIFTAIINNDNVSRTVAIDTTYSPAEGGQPELAFLIDLCEKAGILCTIEEQTSVQVSITKHTGKVAKMIFRNFA